MANRAAGKGYENIDNYDNIRFKFIGIENIHVMRSSLQKLLEGVLVCVLWQALSRLRLIPVAEPVGLKCQRTMRWGEG